MNTGTKIILVIGDVMLDRYIYGTIDRVSPEASCPIFEKTGIESCQLGAASNVAIQIRNAGFSTFLIGQIGNDYEGAKVRELLEYNDVDCSLLYPSAYRTTVKERYISNANQQVFRIDYEECNDFPETVQQEVIDWVQANADNICCIVLSDYNKGVLAKDFCTQLIKLSNELLIPTIVDIKVNDVEKYRGATIIKGNIKEFSGFITESFRVENLSTESVLNNLHGLKNTLDAKGIIVTCGSQGIAAIGSDNSVISKNANLRTIFDVTGAGDVVTAYIGIGIGKGLQFREIVNFSNKAAGLSVSSLGNSLINPTEVFHDTKTIHLDALKTICKGKQIVFTNGCFDVLHVGHLDLLNQSKGLGDILVVGLNSDDSVRKLKGKKRPFNCFDYRAKMLSSLSSVDYIVEFNEDTPIQLIKELRPDVLVKGGDYNAENIVGADFVVSYGGKVAIIPLKFKTSTSQILNYGE